MTISPANAVATRQAQVPLDAAGRRIDQVLAEMFPEFSRSRLAAWIKAGKVTLDGHVPRPRDAVHGGEQVELNATLEVATESAPEAIGLDVLYEDEHLLVINKPVGLVVAVTACTSNWAMPRRSSIPCGGGKLVEPAMCLAVPIIPP